MEIIIALVVVILGVALYFNRKPSAPAVVTSTVAETVTTVVENKVEEVAAPAKKAPAKKTAAKAPAKKVAAKKAPAKKVAKTVKKPTAKK